MHILALILGFLQIAPEIAQEILAVVAHAKGITVPATASALLPTATPKK